MLSRSHWVFGCRGRMLKVCCAWRRETVGMYEASFLLTCPVYSLSQLSAVVLCELRSISLLFPKISGTVSLTTGSTNTSSPTEPSGAISWCSGFSSSVLPQPWNPNNYVNSAFLNASLPSSNSCSLSLLSKSQVEPAKSTTSTPIVLSFKDTGSYISSSITVDVGVSEGDLQGIEGAGRLWISWLVSEVWVCI